MSGEDEPNEETLASFHEVDEMKKTGSGRKFDNLDDLWASLEDFSGNRVGLMKRS